MWSNTLIQIIERDVSVNLRNICAVIRCFNMLDIFESKKKYVQNSYFFAVILPQIPSPIGDLKIPSGTSPGPRGFSNPLWAQGIWGKIPLKKSGFYI